MSLILDKPKYFGKLLHQRGFRDWMIYMFNVIEQKKFVVEELHEEMFVEFQNIYDMEQNRNNVNVPPRSAKTTFAIYFIAYTLADNPKSEFIYTSFSQDLLTDISRKLTSILQHSAYKSMYNLGEVTEELVAEKPIDDFWQNYLGSTEGKEQFSNRKIITKAGGIVYFPSIGSNITGFGAGRRNAERFSGALIIDDGNKPAEIRSQVMRDKTKTYFDETLLSRLNDSKTSIINIQQRLHLEDLSGYLISTYNYHTFSKPLVNDDGVCCLPSQYTSERIRELQINTYLFLSQYQQQPIKLGGSVIKTEWWRYFDNINSIQFKKVFIVGDTAQKTKEHNDYSVFTAWGADGVYLYLLDGIRGKWEAPDLKKQAQAFWLRMKNYIPYRPASAFYVEDKASGTGLIQDLAVSSSIPIMGVQRNVDKLTRLEDILPYIESGRVLLPFSKEYGFNPQLISEAEAFARDMSHKHDDIIDTVVDAINKAFVNISMLDCL